MSKEDSIKAAGLCSFEITEGNKRYLDALIMYTKMIDCVCEDISQRTGTIHEPLSVDGLINAILDDAFKQKVKSIRARHGFESDQEFVCAVGGCTDGEQVRVVVRNAENKYYITQHRKVLEQIPMDDPQKYLPI